MSFNIRYDNPKDGENAWPNRKEFVLEMLNEEAPDIIGMQEVLYHQKQYISANMNDYLSVGVGRDNGKVKGEFSPIFYNDNKLRLIKWQNFWLSETPDKPGKGWDAACNRIVTYAQFEDIESGVRFHVFNTHFDHRGEEALMNSVALINSLIDSLAASDPFILMGDLNATPESEVIQSLLSGRSDMLKDGFMFGGADSGELPGTYNNWYDNKEMGNRIDYIFFSTGWIASDYRKITVSRDGRYVSDHFPIALNLKLTD